ncbi:MAG: N,N-dimethylformamidase beta subunit family domain-containing protein [Gaiellaceae bacterium]
MIRVLSSLGAVVLLAGLIVGAATPGAGEIDAIRSENAKAGTLGWLGIDNRTRAIEVYASATDALPGDDVPLHVSTAPAARYRILVYRLGWYGGVGAQLVSCLPACDGAGFGVKQPVPAPDATGYINAGWPVTDSLHIGEGWVSGYYLIRVLLLSGPAAGSSATTFLVVRRFRSTSAILVQVPVNTWEAYNGWGGKSLYPFSSADGRQAIRVSFDRPFNWFVPGGQRPLGWELPFVGFLERQGYDVSYQSDVWTNSHPRSLLHHRLDVVAGHDEYWTKAMRDSWGAARDAGVNLAFMGANAAYWQVRLQDDGRTILTYKSMYDPEPDPALKTAMFRELVPPRYECELIGIQHQGVGLNWQPGDYTVQPGAFATGWTRQTGLRSGAVIRGIVSVESDTIPGNQTAASSCGNALTVLFHRQRGGDKDGNADATVYTAPSGARVFASGSHQFAWALTDFQSDPDQGHGFADSRLQRFMTNAFDDLSGQKLPFVGSNSQVG